MAPLATATRLCLRSATAATKPAAVRALSSTAACQAGGDASAYSSPFKLKGESKASQVPDFGKYMTKGNETTNKLFSYFMVGTMGAITAAGAKSTVQGGF
jgi:ubiquinol-cytochrome c reductase iron-sulfur subunit